MSSFETASHAGENPEFAGLVINEANNPYRTCIQGLANEPITVLALLRRAENLLGGEPGFARLVNLSLKEIVARLAANRPRVCIIQGSPDHPAHLYDLEHALRAAARVWQNGGVPFTFGLPVICDGTAQSNIGQSYSLASRNHTAMTVNINFEGHSYHAAYVIAGCDKTPTGILAGLAAADRARRHPARGNAPVWAVFVPAHVLRGGEIPPTARQALRDLQARAAAAGDVHLAHDIEENCRYILQCSSDEAFLSLFNRAVEQNLITREQAHALLDELAAATCDEKGGICAFNGTGNSSRTLVAALGFVPVGSELLTDEAPTDVVFANVDTLFRSFNKRALSVCDLLERNFANAIRIHCATGSSTNLLLHMPAVMRHAGFDVSLADFEAVRYASAIPDIFAHSLTEGRDTFALALQAKAGLHHGIDSLVRILSDLQVPMDLDAPTVMGDTWGERIARLATPVSPKLAPERSIIRVVPVRDISGCDVLRGNFFESCAVKVAGMSSEHISRFESRVFMVRYYENEADCMAEMQSADLLPRLAAMVNEHPDVVCALATLYSTTQAADAMQWIEEGALSFAFVIAGQGPQAFGMPEMFAPSQSLRHHGVLERYSILMTDGRYSGVTKGPCVGHVTPEAWEGGGIGLLQHGDLLWLQLAQRRIDWIDPVALCAGHLRAISHTPNEAREMLVAQRKARMQDRRDQIAACNLMDDVSTAEYGAVPGPVQRRATLPWSVGCAR
ncbi:MAG: dihydroxy-acid dehydratase [Pseudomonadota bacterium]